MNVKTSERTRSLACALALATALAAGPARAAGETPAGTAGKTDVVAREGSVTLTAGDVQTLLQELDPASRAKVLSAPNGVADLVRERLAALSLLAEANQKNWAARPEIAQQIDVARRGVIEQSYLASVSVPPASYPSDAEIQAAYDGNKSQFALPRTYNLSQVVIPGAQNAPPKKPPAALYASATPTDVGPLPENRMSAALRTMLSGMKAGQLTAPFYLQDGWHVLKVVSITPPGTATLAQVRSQIVEVMRRQKAQANARAYLDAMQQKGHVEINEIALANAVPK